MLYAYAKYTKERGPLGRKQAGRTSWEKNKNQIVSSKMQVPPSGGTLTQRIIDDFTTTHIIMAVRT